MKLNRRMTLAKEVHSEYKENERRRKEKRDKERQERKNKKKQRENNLYANLVNPNPR